jgi:hypothetical protein
MLKRRLALAGLLLAGIFILGLAAGFLLPRWTGSGTAPRNYSTATIIQQVKTISELSTVQYVIERVVILEVPPESLLGQMFAGDNRVLMVAHGIVKAGVDLSQLQPGDIHVDKDRIRIKLPPARITDAYLDEKQTRVIERTTGRFRSFDKDLEQTARQNAVDDIRRAARTGGIVKDAEERARAQLSRLLKGMGGFEVEFHP